MTFVPQAGFDPDLPPGSEGGPPGPPRNPNTPTPSGGNLGGSPGLVTSTGGLFGIRPLLLSSFFDSKNKNFNLQVTDPFNFDTEENAFYYFPNPDACGQQRPAIPVTVNNIAIVYRELGIAAFIVGIIVYNRQLDTYIFKQKQVVINNISPKTDIVNFPFPDGNIHTVMIPLVIDGERPQAFINRFANSGPLSIISLTLIGVADTKEIMGGQR